MKPAEKRIFEILNREFSISISLIFYEASIYISSNKVKAILNLRRLKQHGETELGKLTIEGVDKSWFVLELGGPDSKVEGSDRRISAGVYKMEPFSGRKYKNVYELKKVPRRTYILMYAGNYHVNTEGCLMLGKNWGTLSDSNCYVTNSKIALKEIFSEIKNFQCIEIRVTNQLEK